MGGAASHWGGGWGAKSSVLRDGRGPGAMG